MGGTEVANHSEQASQRLHTRWEHAQAVAHDRVGTGFVERAPILHLGAVLREHPGGEACDVLEVFFLLEPAEVFKPQRVREVVQRDHRDHVAGEEVIDQLVVVGNGFFIELAGSGLDAAP